MRDWLLARAKKKMESTLKDITGRSVEIEFLTGSQIVDFRECLTQGKEVENAA